MDFGIVIVVALLVGVAAVVVAGAVAGTRAERSRFDASAAALAARLGGRFVPGGVRRIEWRIRGRAAELKVGFDSQLGGSTSSVTVDLRGRSPGALKVFPEGEPVPFSDLYGQQDLRVGDPSFDARFVVKASPDSLARAVFSPERRAEAVAAITRLSAFGPPFVDLSKERLRMGVTGSLVSKAALQAVARSAEEMTAVVLDAEPGAEILWVEERLPAGGLCQVCGTAMTREVVHCARCRTPHHEECWTWTGECSTFACKETRYVAGGRTISPPPRRQKPDDWLREELERDRRATGGAVEESIRRFEQRQRERRGG